MGGHIEWRGGDGWAHRMEGRSGDEGMGGHIEYRGKVAMGPGSKSGEEGI